MASPVATVFFIYFSVTGLVTSARTLHAKVLDFIYSPCHNEITTKI